MKLSKLFYLGSILGAPVVAVAIIAVGFMGAVGGAASGSDAAAQAGVGAMLGSFGLAWLAILYGAAVQLLLIYKAWSAINDGQARTTPGKAAGFLLIPLFNIYWVFQAIYGFAQDYNKFIARHQKQVPALDEKLFLAYPIAVLACIIPLVNFLAAPVSLVLAIIVGIKMIDGVNALADAPRAAAANA
ncbi:MAG TPA: hypothetical protein VMZ25_00730 [Terriglobales bacterium]|nr:hypothetical protein [Terriglobales bacterium]